MMAKKLRRVTKPLWLLFIELLIPWLSMGALAVIASAAGLTEYMVFAIAIGGALVTTWAVFFLDRRLTNRRLRKKSSA
jgi:membrane protein DedA with SNARE-associated domain